MSAVSRRWFLGATAAGLAFQAGCSFATLAYFLTPEQRTEAKITHLAHKETRKAPKIVIVTHARLDIDPEMINADSEVAERLGQQLQMLAKAYGEKVTVVRQRDVEDYKNKFPSWRTGQLTEIGEHFKASHVVYLEFLSLAMREPRLVNMFKGKANINAQVWETAKPDEPPMAQNLTLVYPDDSRPGITMDNDIHPDQFRQDFLARVAKKLVPYFANHPRQELYKME